MSDPGYRRAAWSWTRHLRAGGGTPWAEWVGGDAEDDPEPPAGWVVPGAAELELVRRLARRGPSPALPRVADVVLGRSGPGRGQAQQPLCWAGQVHRFGAPPVDPADVPLEELLRVGTGALAELLLAAPGASPPPVPPRRRLLTRTPAFVLLGAPVTVAVVRRALGRAGHVEGGRSPLAVVLAEPLDGALVQVWSARVQGGSAVRWHGFVERCRGRDRLPPAVDVAARAREHPGPVQVVVPGPEPVSEVVARVLGVSAGMSPGAGERGAVAGVRDLTPAAVEVLRRSNGVLDVRAEVPRREQVRERLVRLLAAVDGDRRLTVPEGSVGWVREHAARVTADLAAGGYRVHGRAAGLAPRPGPTHPRRREVLDVLLDTCLAQADDRPAPTHPTRPDRGGPTR